MNNVLTSRARLAAPPATVYRALTDPPSLRRWLAEHAEVSIPEGRYEFWGLGTPVTGPGRQRLLAAEDDRLLRLSWTLDGDGGAETVAELVLEPGASTSETVLTLTQTGVPSWEEMAPSSDVRVSVVLFWGLAVANLADLIEGREVLPFHGFGEDHPSLESRAEILIAAPPEEVFESLLDPAQLKRWGDWDSRVEPEVGGTFVLQEGGDEGKILDLEPGKALTYSIGSGQLVRWELAGSNGGTYLSMIHSGFDSPAAAAQQEIGWVSALLELRRIHELGAEHQPLSIAFDID